MKNSETKEGLVAYLRYQLERYKSMKNGFMCQQVSSQLRSLVSK